MTLQARALAVTLALIALLALAPKLWACEPTVEELIYEAWPDDYAMARCIGLRESGLEPLAIDGSGTYAGVFQIAWRLHRQSFSAMLDGRANIAFARQLFDDQGWRPWAAAYALCRLTEVG